MIRGPGQKFLDYGRDPPNRGVMPDADLVGEVSTEAKGEKVRIYIKLGPDERVTAATFEAEGIPSLVPPAAAATELVLGRTVGELAAISNADLADRFGGLPDELTFALIMVRDALEAAAARHRGVKSRVERERDSPLVCTCFQVREAKLERVIAEYRLGDIDAVRQYTRACSGCHSCRPDIEDLLDRAVMKRGDSRERSGEIEPVAPELVDQAAHKVLEVAHAWGTPALASLLPTLPPLVAERLRTAADDDRAAVAALGCFLLKALTGRSPEEAGVVGPESAGELIRHHRLPPAIGFVIARSVSRDSSRRHASVDELVVSIQHAVAAVLSDSSEGGDEASDPGDEPPIGSTHSALDELRGTTHLLEGAIAGAVTGGGAVTGEGAIAEAEPPAREPRAGERPADASVREGEQDRKPPPPPPPPGIGTWIGFIVLFGSIAFGLIVPFIRKDDPGDARLDLRDPTAILKKGDAHLAEATALAATEPARAGELRDKALACFEAAFSVAIDAKDPAAITAATSKRARLLADLGRPEEARAAVEQGLEHVPDDPALTALRDELPR